MKKTTIVIIIMYFIGLINGIYIGYISTREVEAQVSVGAGVEWGEGNCWASYQANKECINNNCIE